MELSIFDFDNYREYLSKVMMPNGPYQQKGSNLSRWSKRLGHSSPSLLSMVLKGDRTPSDELLEKLVSELKLSRTEANFLRLKVKLERMDRKGKSSATVREELDQLIQSVVRSKRTVVSLAEFEVISQWYVLVIKQMIESGHFVDDTEWIARKLKNKIRPAQAKKALENLESIGAIKKNPENGRWEVPAALSTGNDVPSPAIVQHHAGMLDRAKEALEEQTVNERHVMGMTFRADPLMMPQIKKEITQFIELMNEKYSSETSSRVYQLGIQFFQHTTEVNVAEMYQ